MKCFCNYCGAEINRSPAHISKRNFCCRECYTSAKKEDKTLHPSYKGGKYITCHNCGDKTYKSPSTLVKSKHNFCSRKCFGAWNSKNKTGKSSPNYREALLYKACNICGKEFTTYLITQTYCSVECKAKSQLNQEELVCTECVIKFTRSKGNIQWAEKRGSKNVFCSKECQKHYHKGKGHPAWILDRGKLKSRNKSIRSSNEMTSWRDEVFMRDDFTCKLCGAKNVDGQRVVLNAHHIIRFAEDEHKRFDSNNGITLCEKCHKKTYGKEESYANIFFSIVRNIR